MAGFDFDLFVIGGGSGGVRAARIAAGYGAKVALAEEYRMGGTCVIRGCVPKKLLVYASRFPGEFEDVASFGWTVPGATFSWPALIAAKDKEIGRLEGIYTRNLEKAGVTVLKSRAVLEGTNSVRLADGRRVTAKTILVATGGHPRPETALPGHELTITSNEAFHLPELPKRIVIVGGGYIALEFAGIFHGLGAETTVLYRGEEILRGFDDDVRKALHEAYVARGIKIICGEHLTRIERLSKGLVGLTDKGTQLEAEQFMLAIGRVPNTGGLGLEAAGVAMDVAGAIKVDANSRSNVPSIYAVGDVTNRVNLTPVAIREGHAFADSVFGGHPVTVNYDAIPTAVFSTPEIGTVGLSEQDARNKFGAVDIYKTSFRPMKAVLGDNPEKMLMKIVVDGATDRVLGVHILGPDAGEMAQVLAIAVRMGATKRDFDQTMALHPSAAEELVTLRTKWQPPSV